MTADAFSRVFASGYPYGEPFRPELRHRLVVGLILDELAPSQFEALAAAARAVGDEELLYAEIARGEEEREHWPAVEPVGAARFSFADYDTYFRQPTSPRTKALWSPSARWGLLITTDWIGLVAGVADFDAVFRQRCRLGLRIPTGPTPSRWSGRSNRSCRRCATSRFSSSGRWLTCTGPGRRVRSSAVRVRARRRSRARGVRR